jgi:hypothetical protein
MVEVLGGGWKERKEGKMSRVERRERKAELS